jgi:flagellar protein FlgJ
MDSTSLITQQPNQAGGAQRYHNYADVGALNELKVQAREDQRAALRPVAEQFEALFVQQIFKEARKVSFDDNWLDGDSGEFYKDWYDKQLAQDLAAKGTLGFADNIVEQLAPREPYRRVAVGASADSQPAAADAKAAPAAEWTGTQQALALRKIK